MYPPEIAGMIAEAKRKCAETQLRQVVKFSRTSYNKDLPIKETITLIYQFASLGIPYNGTILHEGTNIEKASFITAGQPGVYLESMESNYQDITY